MIELPNFAGIGSVEVTYVDAGFTQQGISSDSRIDRKGTRYMASCSYGPYHPDQAGIMLGRLLSGKRQGIRIPYPLLVDQGNAGTPVVNGGVQTGRILSLRGLHAGYACREGYFLSLVKDGQHFLHNVETGGIADINGELTITLNEMIRDIFADGAEVHLQKPMIQGLVEGSEQSWSYSADRLIPFQFTIKETK